VNQTDDHDQLHVPQQPGEEEAYRGRSEEGLIENTWWAQWAVCCAITQTCYRVSFWCRSFIQITARTVGCQSKSQGTRYCLGLIVYNIVVVKIFERYRNIALSIRALLQYSKISRQSRTSTFRRLPFNIQPLSSMMALLASSSIIMCWNTTQYSHVMYNYATTFIIRARIVWLWPTISSRTSDYDDIAAKNWHDNIVASRTQYRDLIYPRLEVTYINSPLQFMTRLWDKIIKAVSCYVNTPFPFACQVNAPRA